MFHVYHKVKGDRMGPADYRFVSSHSTRLQAQEAAEQYNLARGYKVKGIHRAVVRTRTVH